jgi:hypothetical protein
MVQAAVRGIAWPGWVERLVESPQDVERGLARVDAGLRLGRDLVVDLLAKDATGRAVVVLVEDEDGVPALLGRGVAAIAHVRRMRELLDRLFQASGLSFGRDPRVVLLARRFDDALADAKEKLRELGLECREAQLATLDGATRLVVADSASASATSSSAVAPVAVTSTAPAPAPAPVAPSGNSHGNGHGPTRPAPRRDTTLFDEAKKKILRISDDVEEEVAGESVRFKLHDELLALLEPSGEGFAIAIGDAPDRARLLVDRAQLHQAVDDVVRRYFTLARRHAARAPSSSKP